MKIYILILLLAFSWADLFNQEENGVIVLNNKNFKQVLSHYPNILIDFYAPWCGKCTRFEPKFEKACKVLKKSDKSIQCAKIDADTYKEIATEYDAESYPTLILFEQGNPKRYDGAMRDHSVIGWALTGENVSSLKVDLSQIEEMAQTEHVFYAFFGDIDSKEFKTYNMIAKFDEHRNFVHTDDPAAIEKYNARAPTLLAFRQFDEPVVHLEGEFGRISALTFIRLQGIAKCMYFNDIDSVNIFRGKRTAAFLAVDPDAHPKVVENFCNTAKADDSKVLYAWVDVKNPEQEEVREYIDIKDKESPHLSIVHFDIHFGMMRFDYKGDASTLTSEDIERFISRFQKGSVESRYYDDQEKAWYDVTNPTHIYYENYDQVVLNEDADVVVYFYDNREDRKVVSFHQQLGKLSKEIGKSDEFVLARYDWHKNPPTMAQNTKPNSIVLFTKDDKSKGITFEGEGTYEEIRNFLLTNSPVYKEKFGLNEDL
ncbi:unnamed protein product [Moneuplotes crassus]|uniref:Thioredoxin domain-containing protein n=1 Tax=Euplotes crassus TaxID=5936 RepID=A0AAD1UK64_EUPCR|nr:unnamed protein product [Moneuplotes crassus]